jgi:hypothetical protein
MTYRHFHGVIVFAQIPGDEPVSEGSQDKDMNTRPGAQQSEPSGTSQTSGLECAFHPGVPTVLRCGKCDRPICPRCLIQTPVGGRCRDCAQMRRLPMYEASPADLVRGALVAIGLGIAGGVGLGFFVVLFPRLGLLFSFLVTLGLGYVIGGFFSDLMNRKQATPMKVLLGTSIVLAFILRSVFALILVAGWQAIVQVPAVFLAATAALVASPMDLIMVGIAIWVAIRRL